MIFPLCKWYFDINWHKLEKRWATGGPSSEYEELYSFFFLLLCKHSAKRDLWHILLPNNRIGPRETWLSPCSIWGCCVTTVGRSRGSHSTLGDYYAPTRGTQQRFVNTQTKMLPGCSRALYVKPTKSRIVFIDKTKSSRPVFNAF